MLGLAEIPKYPGVEMKNKTFPCPVMHMNRKSQHLSLLVDVIWEPSTHPPFLSLVATPGSLGNHCTPLPVSSSGVAGSAP